MRSRRKKGIVGIEAAIVLIAFVIVAASLAFVALNMGLFTTQKSKEVMQRGLEESTTALEVDGSVTAYTSDGKTVNIISLPIKVAPGRSQVDLSASKASIRLILPTTEFEDILNRTEPVFAVYQYSNGTFAIVDVSDTNKIANVDNLSLIVLNDTIWGPAFLNRTPANPEAVIVILKPINNDTVLEYGEKAIVLINLGNYGLNAYDTFSTEIRPPEGAPLTVERTIPASLPSSGSFDLG